MPYQVKEKGTEVVFYVENEGKDYTPQEISAMILAKMKENSREVI